MEIIHKIKNVFIILAMSGCLISCLPGSDDDSSSSSSKGNFTLEGESGGA
jgi:hypothetical protein